MIPKPVRKVFGPVYHWLRFKNDKRKYLKRYKELISQEPLKINIGASGNFYDGWISTDIQILNLLNSAEWKTFFKGKKADMFLAEHVWEHLTVEQGKVALSNCFEYLQPGGHIRIAVPDGYNPDENYIASVVPGGHGDGADDHKLLYNYKVLSKSLEETGYTVRLLEYFDENGAFHFNEWKKEDGMINRSKRYDRRNQDGKLGYTSLIVDGVK